MDQQNFGADIDEMVGSRASWNPWSGVVDDAVPNADEKEPAISIPIQMSIAGPLATGNFAAAKKALKAARAMRPGKAATGSYPYFFDKLLSFLDDDTAMWKAFAESAVQMKGNVKLPFAAYSEFPVVTCPGAGGLQERFQLPKASLGAARTSKVEGCVQWCYSLSALGKPSAMYRFMLTTMASSRDPYRAAETTLSIASRKGAPILRLFVDGDFRSMEHLDAWMEAIRRHPEVSVYGYTKSWHLLEEYAKPWPSNYRVNISGGSRFAKDEAMKERLFRLPAVRGQFLAVDPWEQAWVRTMHKVKGMPLDKARKAMEKWREQCARLEEAAAEAKREHGPRSKKAKEANQRWMDLKDKLVVELTAVDPEFVAFASDVMLNKTWIAKKAGGAYRAWARGEMQLSEDLEELEEENDEGKVDGIPFAPGFVAQAVLYGMTQKTLLPGQTACPISCATCPRQAYADKDGLIKAVLEQDWKAAQEASESERKPRPGANHFCFALYPADGNPERKRDIVIALH